jgi:hypothetical protein
MVGKPAWGTHGRYVNKKLLKALVEELGHEYDSDLSHGSSSGNGADQNLLLKSASNQIAKGDEDDEEDT